MSCVSLRQTEKERESEDEVPRPTPAGAAPAMAAAAAAEPFFGCMVALISDFGNMMTLVSQWAMTETGSA